VMKKFFAVAGVIIFLLSAVLVLSSCSSVQKGDLWMDQVVIDATVNADGSLDVSETWTLGINSSEGYRNFYKTLNLYDSSFAHTSEIKDISVYDNDNSRTLSQINVTGIGDTTLSNHPNTWYIYSTGGSSYELGVIVPSVTGGTRSVTFHYTLTDMVGSYADTAVLYWKQFSEDFELYTENYSCSIRLHDDITTDGVRAWFHTEAEDSNLKIASDSLIYTASDIAQGTLVETRVAIPNANFETLTKSSSFAKLDAMIAEEQDWADAWAEEQKAAYRKAVTNVVISVVFLAVSIGLVVFLRIKNKRIKGEYPKYFRDLPKEWSAGELGHLFYYYEGGVEKQNLRGRLLSATMLELARRNYIEIIPSADDNYKIHVKDISDTMKGDLRPYESTLYRLLGRVENWAKHEFTMNEFEKYAKTHYSDIDNTINEFNTKSKDWFRREAFVGNLSVLNKALSMIGILIGFIGAVIFMYGSSTAFLPIAMVASGIVLFVGAPKVASFNKKGEEEFARAHALKKYMLDFSNLKEYDIPQLILWEEYLVYATMMNISKEVVKNLKLVYPEITKASEGASGRYYNPTGSYLFTYLWLSHSMRGFGAGGGFDLGAHMERSINGIRNTAYNLQHPSSRGGGGGGFGGGGFGGGGGGFGGGGGGGRH